MRDRVDAVVIIILIVIVALLSYQLGLNDHIKSTASTSQNHADFQKISGSEVVIKGKNLTIGSVTGISMLPFFKEQQDAIFETNFDNKDIRVGDVVVWRNSENINVAHRVIWRSDKYFISKGDNSPRQDEMQEISAIFGILVSPIY